MKYPKITLEGKKYPFVLGRGALTSYAMKHDLMKIKTKNIESAILDMSLADQIELNYYCFTTACGVEGKEFPYSLEEFKDLIAEKPYLLDRMDNISESQQPAGNPAMVKESQ